ncbi:unnamed protein product, partial [Ixodes pacificus]
PKITPFSFASKLVSGQRATVTCSTFEGDRPLTFAWLKDGSTLSKHNNVEWNEEKGYSMLNISPLSLQDSGNYTCVVSNSAGSDSLSSSLVVHAPPSWTTEPKDVTVTAGEAVRLECIGTGFPKPKISWTKVGKDTQRHRLPVEETKQNSKTGTATVDGLLKIATATKENEGSYRCDITNGIGASLTKTVSLAV